MSTTLGSYIAEKRKELGLSQKELSQKILREDGKSISPQYLNDIERDRREPSSEHLLQQFATVLNCDADYLHYISGSIPDDARQLDKSPEEVAQLFKAFRKS